MKTYEEFFKSWIERNKAFAEEFIAECSAETEAIIQRLQQENDSSVIGTLNERLADLAEMSNQMRGQYEGWYPWLKKRGIELPPLD